MRIPITVALSVGLVTPLAAQSGSPAATRTGVATPAVTTAPQTEEPTGYTYHPEGRRDPFVSLLRHAATVERGPAGARPAGLAGLNTGEVTLKGTMQARDGYLAMLLGADTKTYIVRPGDHLLDGTIRTITADSLVIVQQVNEPPAPPKQREVRKMLRQTEEAK